ncbi:MAG: DUF5916 domain-containing protein [Candidatus Eisenbacteria bacterium]|nr:DUF5916 domain-containing protein [Candidatus Eisenbacteria bacterium]
MARSLTTSTKRRSDPLRRRRLAISGSLLVPLALLTPLALLVAPLALLTPPAAASTAFPGEANRDLDLDLRVDGRIVEDDWGPPIADRFFRFAPDEDGQPSEATLFYFRQDGRALYFAFRCSVRDPSSLWAPVAKRDQAMHAATSEGVFVYLDTSGEGRTRYFFGVSARGVQEDGVAKANEDLTWDSVWDSAARIDSAGYSVEIRIPFAILRYSSAVRDWHLSAMRFVPATGEVLTHPRASRKILDFTKTSLPVAVRPLRGPGERTVQPYVYADADGSRRRAKAGADAVACLASAAILNLTVHPDFSQVEADVPQIDVNNRSPLYYPEKRPFFLEHAELFQEMPIRAFYSRRIVAPEYGGRASGEIGKSHYTLLLARERREDGVSGSAARDDLVARWVRDLYTGSHLGLTAIAVDGDEIRNLVGGLDGSLRIGRSLLATFDILADRDRTAKGTTRGAAFEGAMGYTSKSLSAKVRPFHYSARFVDRAGYIPRRDFSGVEATGSYRFWIRRRGLASLTPSLVHLRGADEKGKPTDRRTTAKLRYEIDPTRSVTIAYRDQWESFAGSPLDQGLWTVTAMSTGRRDLQLAAEGTAGRAAFYPEAIVGSLLSLTGAATVAPADWLRADLTMGWERMRRSERLLYRAWVLDARAEWTLGLRSFLRGGLRRLAPGDRAHAEILFGRVVRPGDVIYAGIVRANDTSDGGRWTTQGFLKVGRRFDL